MAALATILDAVETQLATISGLRTYEFAPDAVNPPCAFVGLPTEVLFDLALGRGADTYLVPVRVLVSRASDRGARNKLAGYLNPDGATSVKQAIEAGGNLGGTVDSVRVLRAHSVGTVTYNGIDWLSADFDIEIFS